MSSVSNLASRCLGIRGTFSILQDFFRYANIPGNVPGVGGPNVSVSDQARLLISGEHVTIHIRVDTVPTRFTIVDMIHAMRKTYGIYNVALIVGSIQNLPGGPRTINVGRCTRGTVTADQTNLFANRGNIPNNEIMVYFVFATNPPSNGCAAHPVGNPSCIVASGASRWTLAHEVGHVLDLPHVDIRTDCTLNSLMTSCGTGRITNPPPDLSPGEVTTMNNSNLTNPCPGSD